MSRLLFVLALALNAGAVEVGNLGAPLPPLPANARRVINEDWSHGIVGERWYVPRTKWGQGNNGVTRENVRVQREVVNGREHDVLVCQANGDRYAGPVAGLDGAKTRVGGVIISKEFFASGRFEITLKIGTRAPPPDGPADPTRPKGAIPAIWTYAYRYIKVDAAHQDEFVAATPLYNPFMKAYGGGTNEYTSEIDCPEFGKGGNFNQGLYNTYVPKRSDTRVFDVSPAIDGGYHVFTTEWRTTLLPLASVTDAQVSEREGFWWINDKAIPFEQYTGNPLKRPGENRYAVYSGARVEHWIDGKKVGENVRNVPAMAAQLTLGVWMPAWAGVADWETAPVSIAAVSVWQYDDPGDVRGILTASLQDKFDEHGRPVNPR